MKLLTSCVVIGLLAGVCPAADKPASAPTTHPVTADPSTPLGAIKAYGDALPEGGEKAALNAYTWDNDKQKQAALALAKADVAAARLEKVTREKFGETVSTAVVHAMRRGVDADIEKAQEKIDGDTATIEWADGAEPTDMVKVDGKWKIPIADLISGDDDQSIKDATDSFNDMARELDRTVEEVRAGRYANAVLLERAVKQRMFRLLGDDQAE